MGERQDYIALDWVAGEIEETLGQAAQALEAYVANRDDVTKLRFCLTHIHQVHGTLKMVEFFGAALLAEEMEGLAQALSQGAIHDSHIDDALLVLKTAIAQLPLYLEKVKESRHGLPATLLPVLNDLRAVRGESLLSETVLFAPDMTSAAATQSAIEPMIKGAELAEVAHKLRQMFQIALLGLIRGRDVRKNLNYLAKVCARLVKLTTGCPPQPLWRVCIAVLEGLLNGSIDASVAVKILLRQVDRQIKLIIDQGESALAKPAPEDLLKNLLYYVARSKANSRFIGEIKTEFNLDASLLGEGELEDESLATPDSTAMHAVVEALVQELSDIKGALSDAGSNTSALTEVLPLFKRVSDTMAILGMGTTLKQVQEPYSHLAKLLATQDEVSEAEMAAIIEQIVTAQTSLDPTDIVNEKEEKELFYDSEEAQEQLDGAFDSVIRESRVGLEQAKEAIIEFVATQWNHDCLADVPSLLIEIRGSLNMVPLTRAAGILQSCENYVREVLLAERAVPEWQMLDTLADAITSIDYFLERLADDADAEGEAILDVAAESVAELGYPVTDSPAIESTAAEQSEVSEMPPGIGSEEPVVEELVAEEPPVIEEIVPEVADVPVLAEVIPFQPAAASTEPEVEVTAEASEEDDDDFDPEIVEIFIEEAGEVLETINEFLPQWQANLGDEEARTTLRRAFHTLKGSGRMVGAVDIGELGWSVENMLNRVLDGTVEMDEPRFQLVNDVVAQVPSMVSAFEHRKPVDKVAIDALIERGNRLAKEQNPVFEELAEESVAQAVEDTAIEITADVPGTALLEDTSEDEIDTELLEIFAAEAATHGQVLDDFIAHCRELAGPASLTDELQRALHTLKGSANMAGVDPVVTVVTPVEHLVKELRSSQLKADGSVVGILERASLFIKVGIEQLETTPLQEVPGVEAFIEQLNAVYKERMAQVVSKASDDVGIPPEAMNQFLTQGLDRINEVSAKLELWQSVELNPSEFDSLQAITGRFTEHAESVNMLALVEFGQAMQALYRQAAEVGRPQLSTEFYDLATAGNDGLIDMLDQIAGHQEPNFDVDLLTRIQDFEFAIAADEEDIATEVMTELVEVITRPEDDSSVQEPEDLVAADVEGIVEDIDEDIDEDIVEDIVEDTAEEIVEDPVEELASESIEPPVLESEPDEDLELLALGDEPELEAVPPLLEPEPPVLEVEPPEPVAIEPESLEPEDEPAPVEQAPAFVMDDDDDDGVDDEIIEIFLEEADDLVEAMEEAIHKWDDARDSREPLDDLLRILHTMKGGARLTKLTELGNLSHNFETALISADTDGAMIDDDFMSEVHRFQDKIIAVVAAVKAGETVPVTSELVDEPGDVEETPATADSVIEEASEEQGEAEVPIIAEVLELDIAADTLSASDDIDKIAAEQAASTEPEKILQEVPAPAQEKPVVAAASNKPAADKPKTVAPFIAATPRPGAAESPVPQMDVGAKKGPQEVVKVSAQLLEELVNLAGETSISRGRAEEQISELVFSLDEMQITVDRLQDQVRRLDMETEQQILFRQEQVESEGLDGFDPLEMDRYSALQQLSRSLLESSSDLIDIKSTLADKSRDMETLLVQQSRINTDLQEGLMRSRMVPFSRMVPRLRRIIRQVSGELNKKVDFHLDNVEGELDRSVLERMVAPLEHMLRNAVDHGIESAEVREKNNKPARGTVALNLSREGGEIVLTLTDDGAGIDLKAVRAKAIERGLMEENADLSDHEILQFIVQAGFSTAEKVTQISGRGVGMDVVHSEIKQLGGSMDIESVHGQGSRFIVRLPFTVSVNRALMVNVGGDRYAIPLNTIEGIVRVSPFELEAYYQPDAPMFEYAGQPYLLRYMGALLHRGEKPILDGQSMPLPVVLVRGAEHSVAIQVDSLLGSREIVVKPLGPQFSMVQGLSGATVLGDGSVVVILDLMAMIRADASHMHKDIILSDDRSSAEERVLMVMVVDDSVTVRKVTSRFLERQGMEVLLAKDGVDAVTQLQEIERIPDLMLLDIEMPRMDGFEVASRVRHTERLKKIPIIMITSRTGEKHRERALSLGVNEYLGKPYQEAELLETINSLMGTLVG